jgi:hypothetical protein
VRPVLITSRGCSTAVFWESSDEVLARSTEIEAREEVADVQVGSIVSS